jgi:hypothetical protein
MSSSSAPSPRVNRGALARALLLVEGATLLLIGGILAVLTAVERPARLEAALFEVMAAVGAGVLLVIASRKVGRSIHWRSPVLLLNLLAIPVTISLAQAGQWLISVPLGVLAVSVLVLLAGGKPLS